MTDLEIMQRAKMYLDRLAQGIDPISGREMPEDTVLNQARLARCFSYVSGILQQVIDNGGTVGPLQRNDFTWTPEMLSHLTPADQPLRITEFAQRLAAASADPNTKMPRTTLVHGLASGKRLSGEGPGRREQNAPHSHGPWPEHRAVHGSPCGQIWRVPGHLL